MIDNLEHYGGQRYLVSGHIEIELLVVHGIEASTFDARVGFRHAYTVTVQGELDIRV